ncbi:MAG TPA: hypothetical protein VMU84_04205 [Thermoanaerobaculia bacterium]|nr:hypothetical protein [Thermoanaerobaculia bacterium]
MDLVPLLVPIFTSFASFGMVCFVVWTISRNRSMRARMQAEVQTRLIERFGTAPELVEFLKSPEGKSFVGDIERMPRYAAGDHILGGLRKGIVVALLGLGFLAVYAFWPNLGMLIPGFLLLTLGLGFAISTFVSIRLSRSWGIFPKKNDDIRE